MTNNKAREINSPVIKQLLDETTPEELAKIDAEMTNNKQQTAVQWFLEQLIEHRIIVVNQTTYQVKCKHEILLEQAKEMEKEQMENAQCGYIGGWNEGEFDEWYEQTYGGSKP